ncbi:hypothetical protein J7M23_06685 [Candidatus Sumerlaeota bacterium]|nr:hypothetical protein [Candidatus Sumerlaeota bacterium]
MNSKRIKIRAMYFCIVGLFCCSVACGVYYKASPYVDYKRLSPNPLERVAVLPFDSTEEQNRFLAERLRRYFYLGLVNNNIPTVPLSYVDSKVVYLCRRTNKKPENILPAQLTDCLATHLIAQGELTNFSYLYLLFYSHIKASGKFWITDYRTGNRVFYNEVSATNRKIALPTSLLGLATEGIGTLAYLRSSKVIETIRGLGEYATEPLANLNHPTKSSEQIKKIKVNVASRKLKIGDVIEVEAWGPAGRSAWFDIGAEGRRVPMEEKTPGYYVGRYVISAGDSVEYGLVRVAMTTTDKSQIIGAINFDTPLSIDADPPPPPVVSEFYTTKKSINLTFSLIPRPKDLEQILVYRAVEKNGKRGEFNFIGTLRNSNLYVDKKIKPSTTYYYTAIAIDRAGNTSGAGRQFKIALPPKGPILFRGPFRGSLVLMRYASPFFIDSKINIEEHSSVIIEPGVEIYFSPGGGFQLKGGTLKASGTEKAKILLYPSAKKWAGISANRNPQNRISLENVRIYKADKGIAMSGGTISLSRTELKRCSTALVLSGESINAWLYQCRFVKNTTAILTSAQRVSFNHCDFIKNRKNIVIKETLSELLPEKKVYDFSAYLSKSHLLPSRNPLRLAPR